MQNHRTSTQHAAIPTVYRGIQMRSRLEARWASVFDQIGWAWEYEPVDFNGWIPDFLVTNPHNIKDYFGRALKYPLLVEVKPLIWLRENCFPDNVRDQIEGALGAPPTRSRGGRTSRGELWNEYFENLHYDAMVAGIGPYNSWLQMRHAGWHRLIKREQPEPYCLWWPPRDDSWERVWAAAGNKTQWRAPR